MKGRKRTDDKKEEEGQKKEEDVKEFSIDKSQTEEAEGSEAAGAEEEVKAPEVVLKDPPPPLDTRGKLALLQKNMGRIGGFAGEEEAVRLHQLSKLLLIPYLKEKKDLVVKDIIGNEAVIKRLREVSSAFRLMAVGKRQNRRRGAGRAAQDLSLIHI